MIHPTKTKLIAALLALVMVVTLLPIVGTGVNAAGSLATGDCSGRGTNVIYNYGDADITCTALSDMANAYYTGSNSYASLSLLAGSASSPSSSALYSALQRLMATTQTKNTSYDELKTYYEKSDCENGSTSTLRLFYSGDDVASSWSSDRNREHVWPKSNASFNESNGGSDLHHLRPADPTVNSSRSNLPFGNVTGGKTITRSATGSVAGESGDGYFEPTDSMKGDCARIILYVFVRWNESESNLSAVFESSSVLLDWMASDPVSTWEMGRNDAVQTVEGNRNVFIDYPELGFKLFNAQVPANYQTPSSQGTPPSAETYSISYYENGTLNTGYGTEYTVVNAGSSVTLPASVTAPAGYVFCGWVEEAITTATDTAPTILTSFTPTKDSWLYALYAVESAGGASSSYRLVTDASSLDAGDTLILVAEKTADNTFYAAGAPSAASGDTFLTSISVTAPANEVISLGTEAVDTFTLGGSSTGWTLSSTGQSKTLGYNGSKNTITYDKSDDAAKWTIAIADGKATITNVGTATRMLQFNASAPRFACYTTAQDKPYIYRQESGTTLSGYITNIGTVPPVPTEPPTATDTPVPTGTPEPTNTPALPSGNVYEWVQNAGDITAGDYLLVAPADSKAMNATLSSGRFGSTDVVIENDRIVCEDDTLVWSFGGTISNAMSIKNANTGSYLQITGNTTAAFALSAEPDYTFSLSFDSSTDVKLATSAEGRRIVAYYASSSDFRSYAASNNTGIRLFKRTNESSTPVQTYPVSFSAGEGGTLEVMYNGEALTSGATVPENSVITVTATPNEGYALASLMLNGTAFTNDSTHAVTGSVSIAATFTAVQQYSVSWTVPANGSIEVKNGTTAIANGASVLVGTELTISATANEGYELESLTVNEAAFVSGGIHTVAGNVAVAASFLEISAEPPARVYTKVTSELSDWSGEYIIVYEDGTTASVFNGNLEGLDAASNFVSADIVNNTITVAANAAPYFTVAAVDGGYSILSRSGFYIGNTSDANALKTSATTAYVNTIAYNSEGSCADIVSAAAYLRFNPNSGQTRFRYYKSATYTAQKAIQLYKYSGVAADSYAVSYSAGEGGTVTVEYNGSPIASGAVVPKDGVITVTATPNEGYALASLTLNGTAFTSGSTHTVTGAVSIAATFTAVQQYSVSWTEPENGSIEVVTASETPVTNNSTVLINTVLTISASPAAGYYLKALTVNDVAHTSGNSYTVTGNTVIAAEFAKVENVSYELVTELSQLVAGDTYIIAGSKAGSVAETYDLYVLTTTQNSNNRASSLVASELSAIPQTLSVPSSASVQTLTLGQSGDYWTFLAASADDVSGNDGYLCSASSSSNYLRTVAEEPAPAKALWSLALGEGSVMSITADHADNSFTRNSMRFNGNNNPPIFSCYASTSTISGPLYLYRKASSGNSLTVTFTAGGVEVGTRSVTAGGTLSASDIPAVPAKTDDPNYAATDYAGWWSVDLTTTPITENTTVTAVYRLWGDANDDGSVTVVDAALMLRHAANLGTLDERALYVCDVSNAGDGITVVDISVVLRRTVGLISMFEVTAN